MDTLEWRHNGERQAVVNFPDPETSTARQTLDTYVQVKPLVDGIRKLIRSWESNVRMIVAHDYNGEYNVQDGRVLEIKQVKRIKKEAVPQMIALCAKLGEDITATTIDSKKLKETLLKHPELQEVLQDYVEFVGEGTLAFKGRKLKVTTHSLDEPSDNDLGGM